MSIEKEKIQLRNADIPLSFGLSLSSETGKVTIKYVDNYEDEVIYDFYSFLEDLSQYYRNRIDTYENFEEKINLCSNFLDTMQGYKIDFRNVIKDQEKFYKEIDFHKEQFNYYKNRFKEAGDLKVSKSNNEKLNFSTKQQILILEYLGFLKSLNELDINEKQKGDIVSAIIGKDTGNVIKAIRNSNKAVETGSVETKTRENLKFVLELFKKNNLNSFVEKVQEDIKTIKKG